jgi:hypothetical protein
MKYKIPIFFLLFVSYLDAYQLSEYEAKYAFESKEISITGIREFKKNQDNYEIRFEASNILASLFFSSKFNINNDKVLPKTYDIKIRPKFLKRDQFISFDQQQGFVKSYGKSSWEYEFDNSDLLLDPLNVQVMIRILIKKGVSEFDLNIIDMENGGSKTYTYTVTKNEKCTVSKTKYNCTILERYRKDSDRVVKYYLAKELDFMFIKIIDSSPDKINKLELKEVLSFG